MLVDSSINIPLQLYSIFPIQTNGAKNEIIPKGSPYIFKRLFLFICREKGREGEREGEKHQLVAFHMSLTGDLAPNPGMCLDQEWNP